MLLWCIAERICKAEQSIHKHWYFFFLTIRYAGTFLQEMSPYSFTWKFSNPCVEQFALLRRYLAVPPGHKTSLSSSVSGVELQWGSCCHLLRVMLHEGLQASLPHVPAALFSSQMVMKVSVMGILPKICFKSAFGVRMWSLRIILWCLFCCMV